jgi:hypothetical protein
MQQGNLTLTFVSLFPKFGYAFQSLFIENRNLG